MLSRTAVFFLMAALVIVGCSEEAVKPVTTPAPVVKKNLPDNQPVLQREAQVLVSIVPDPPTADGCLKALVSGSHTAGYRWAINGMEVTGEETNLLCEGFRRGDEVEVTVTVGEATGARSVTIQNAPPKITEVAVNGEGVFTHADLVVQATVVDADDDLFNVRYQWYLNDEADPFLTENILPADRYARGDAVHFTIAVSDEAADGNLYQSETLIIPNAPPQIVSNPPSQFETLEFRYPVEALDPDGDPLEFILENPPPGMRIDMSTGEIVWPLKGVAPGSYPVKIVARDAEGEEAVQEFSMNLGAQADSKPL